MAYSTDLTDAQWELLEPLLGHGGTSGPAPVIDRRQVVNAVLYRCETKLPVADAAERVLRTGTRSGRRSRGGAVRGVWEEVLTYLCQLAGVGRSVSASRRCLWLTASKVKAGRSRSSFHEGHFKYRLNGAK